MTQQDNTKLHANHVIRTFAVYLLKLTHLFIYIPIYLLTKLMMLSWSISRLRFRT